MRPDLSDIEARRRKHTSSVLAKSKARPLLPKYNKSMFPIFLSLVLTLVVLITARNFDDIVRYIDRPITKIKMENQWAYIKEDEIKDLLTSRMGVGFFRFNVNELKSMLEDHPWVKEALVKRIWPDSLALQLEEHVAIARWNENELLNQQGEILRPESVSKLIDLPQLFGPNGSQAKVMEQYQLFSKILLSSDLRLSGLKLTRRGSWDLTINESIEITAGRTELISRLQRFVSFYERQMTAGVMHIDHVDLRYGNGIAVKALQNDLSEVASR